MTSVPKHHLPYGTRDRDSVSQEFVQRLACNRPFLTSATVCCGYRHVPESCWQHTVCHSNKPLPARSCVRPDAGARSCGFNPNCGVGSPCPLSSLVGLVDVRIGETARGSLRILSGWPR